MAESAGTSLRCTSSSAEENSVTDSPTGLTIDPLFHGRFSPDFVPSPSLTSKRTASNASMTKNPLECLHSVKVLQRLVHSLLLLPSPPRTVTFSSSSASPVEWQHEFIAPGFQSFIDLYNAQHAVLQEWRLSSLHHLPLSPRMDPSAAEEAGESSALNMPSPYAASTCSPSENTSIPALPPLSSSSSLALPFSRAALAIWCLTLAYGISLSTGDYSFWTERFLLLTNPALMISMTTGLKYLEDTQTTQWLHPDSFQMGKSDHRHVGKRENFLSNTASVGRAEEEQRGDGSVCFSWSNPPSFPPSPSIPFENLAMEVNGRKEMSESATSAEQKGGAKACQVSNALDCADGGPHHFSAQLQEAVPYEKASSHALFAFPINSYFSSPLPNALPVEMKIITVGKEEDTKREGLWVTELPSALNGEKESSASADAARSGDRLQAKEEECTAPVQEGTHMAPVHVPREKTPEEANGDETWESATDVDGSQSSDADCTKGETTEEEDVDYKGPRSENADVESESYLEVQYENLRRYWLPSAADILADPLPPLSVSSSLVGSLTTSSSLPFLQESPRQQPTLGSSSCTTADDGGSRNFADKECHPFSRSRFTCTPPAPNFSIWSTVKWELSATLPLLLSKPKNFQVWNHRLLLLQHAKKSTVSEMFARTQSIYSSTSPVFPPYDTPNDAQRVGHGERKEEESMDRWNFYLQHYHHRSLSMEGDFDDRAMNEEVLQSNPKNYHAWLYRMDFIRLFPFFLSLPSLEKLQDHLGILSGRSSASTPPSLDASTSSISRTSTASPDEALGSDSHSSEHPLRRTLPSFWLPSCPLRTEFDLTDRFITADVHNNSAWCHRYFMFHSYTLFPLQRAFRAALLNAIGKKECETEDSTSDLLATEEEAKKRIANGHAEEMREKGSETLKKNWQEVEKMFTRMRETIWEVCHAEVTYAFIQLEKELSNECPLTYMRSVAQLFQTFSLRLEMAKTLVRSLYALNDAPKDSVMHASAFLSFFHSPEEALCFVLGSLSSLNMTSSRLHMKAFHQNAVLSGILGDANTKEETMSTSSPHSFGFPGDDHELSWPMLSLLPSHMHVSSLVSWPAYRNSFDLIFQVYDALHFSFASKVEAKERRLLTLLQQGDAKALEEVRETFKTQMCMDHLPVQCEAAKYHLLYIFLEQMWNLYFPSVEATELASSKTGAQAAALSASTKTKLFRPFDEVQKRRSTQVYARDGVGFDMLYPEVLLGEKKSEEKTCEKSPLENSTGSENESRSRVVSEVEYDSMLDLFLYVEAYGLYFAKKLELKDWIRKKYWRNEIKQVLFRRYWCSFGDEKAKGKD